MEQIAGRATDWPFLFFLPWLLLLVLVEKTEPGNRLKSLAPRLACGISLLVLLALFTVAISYLAANFIYNSYATLYAETAWLFCTGRPVYSGIDANEPYSLPYGPAGFIIVGAFQYSLGPSFFSSKLPSFLAAIGSFPLIYLAVRKNVNWRLSLILTALAAALLLFFNPCEFWPRPDPLILFCVSLGLCASSRLGIWGPLLTALALGLAVNLKVYTFIFFLPAASLIFHRRLPLWIWGALGIVSAFIAVSPFLFFSNVSLRDYLLVLKMDGGHRFNSVLALQNVEWFIAFSIIAFAPLIVFNAESKVRIDVLKQNAGFIAGFCIACAMVFIPHPWKVRAASPHAAYSDRRGPGRKSLSRLRLDETCRQRLSIPSSALVLSHCTFIVIYALLISATKTASFIHEDLKGKAFVSDLGSIYKTANDVVLMNAPGSNDTREDDSYRCLLVFNGTPIGIDPVAAMDYRAGGIPETRSGCFPSKN